LFFLFLRNLSTSFVVCRNRSLWSSGSSRTPPFVVLWFCNHQEMCKVEMWNADSNSVYPPPPTPPRPFVRRGLLCYYVTMSMCLPNAVDCHAPVLCFSVLYQILRAVSRLSELVKVDSSHQWTSLRSGILFLNRYLYIISSRKYYFRVDDNMADAQYQYLFHGLKMATNHSHVILLWI
jgi:hypothetical protein